MRQSSTLSIGMDVHTESLAVASVTKDHDAEVIYLGSLGTRPCDMDHLVRKRPSTAKPLVFVYDAGPCGSGLSRYLTTPGQACWVVAPALMPKQAGARVQTDRRDAVPLARLMRAGDRTRVDVPPVEDEALRDLTRARAEALRDLKAAKFRLNAFWRRHDIRSTGRATWGPAHRRWRAAVVCATPAQQLVFQADVRAVTAHTARLQRLAQARQDQVNSWRLRPVVAALEGLRGVPCTVAVTLVAALGDLTRVEKPRPVMNDLGLIPSAYSRGERRQQGALTTAGNAQARRARGEGAWAYRYPAQGRRPWQRRLEPLPKPIQALSWPAPGRLCTRVRRLLARGQHPNQVVVASARELAGFRWAMANEVPVTPSGRLTECH
jgi:transposase